MKRITLSFVVAIAFILLSIAGLSSSLQLPFSTSVTAIGGPGTFPTAYLVIMLVFSVILAVRELITAPAAGSAQKWMDKDDLKRILLLLAMLIAYIAALELVGFYMITTAVLIVGLLWLFGYKNKILYPVIAIVFPILVYLLFQVFLKILLP